MSYPCTHMHCTAPRFCHRLVLLCIPHIHIHHPLSSLLILFIHLHPVLFILHPSYSIICHHPPITSSYPLRFPTSALHLAHPLTHARPRLPPPHCFPLQSAIGLLRLCIGRFPLGALHCLLLLLALTPPRPTDVSAASLALASRDQVPFLLFVTRPHTTGGFLSPAPLHWAHTVPWCHLILRSPRCRCCPLLPLLPLRCAVLNHLPHILTQHPPPTTTNTFLPTSTQSTHSPPSIHPSVHPNPINPP